MRKCVVTFWSLRLGIIAAPAEWRDRATQRGRNRRKVKLAEIQRRSSHPVRAYNITSYNPRIFTCATYVSKNLDSKFRRYMRGFAKVLSVIQDTQKIEIKCEYIVTHTRRIVFRCLTYVREITNFASVRDPKEIGSANEINGAV